MRQVWPAIVICHQHVLFLNVQHSSSIGLIEICLLVLTLNTHKIDHLHMHFLTVKCVTFNNFIIKMCFLRSGYQTLV